MRNSKLCAASLLIARAKSLQLHHRHVRHCFPPFSSSSATSISLFRFHHPWLSSLCNAKSLITTRLFSSYYSLEQFSDDEYDCDFENQQASSTVANVDEWKWKLSMLLRSEKDQEIVSRDRKDRRDYEQIANLAKRMGLYSELFGKVVVASKVPLPNYRPDLDDKRPQREVVIPLSLQRRVEGLLQEYLDRLQLNSAKTTDSLDDVNSTNQVKDINMDENADSFVDESVMEKVLQKRSLRMRNMQRAWQESPEGRKLLEFRKSLPSFKEKQGLLQAIAHNQVIVISGETGCGKTTQLPHYVLESEVESGRGAFCSIICTQPRRISAMAVAERVSAERGEPLGETVGFKVRLEGMKGKNTHLLFCTSGILLRRLLSDRNLNGITHVFVDEIHERGMNEDFLLIVLKDLLPRRRDLRLVLMSATLNAELFSNYFGGAPTFHIPGFTYPVRAHFLEDILEMTGYKLTSFNQIDDYGQEKLWKTQKQLAPRKRKNQITALVEDALSNSSFENYSSRARDSLTSWAPDCIGFNLIEAVLCHICRKERPGAVLVFMTGWEDISSLKDQLKAHPLVGDPNRVLLLTCHGSMATSEQKLIFEKPPPNIRKVILATNMAEASITINDIVFVVDCGKAKETTYDALNNTPCLLPSWISQASARQRRGRAGRVQPGECYHLYPKCVYDAFSEYQLPELLRTPLNSLCLQIKSLQVESIGGFLSAALQAPEPRAVQNAIDFLKMIGALDEQENLTNLGKFLSMLPVDPKLGKMLIMGAIFRCFDPVLTIVAGLSVRDPFLLPQDKRDLAGTAKSRFSAKDYSDHMALVRAYEGWKDAEREGSAYEYCWRNFLSAQTLQAIHSLRKQFSFILKEAGLVDAEANVINKLSHNQSLVRAVICSGLFPGIASVVHRETSMSFKTMDDGQVLLYANSVNARYQTIPYPWLVFGEKVKVNAVFIRDSTGVSDSILILFGGALSNGIQAGHLKMLDGYVDFFMDPNLADSFLKLKEELHKLIQKKLEDPSIDIHKEGKYLMLAVQELVSGDQCEGRFVFGRESRKPKASNDENKFTKDGTNPKSLLQTLLMRAGHSPPKYKTKHLKTNEFRALVEFKGMQFVGKPKRNKQLAERDAAIEALAWLTHTSDNNQHEDDKSPPDVTDNMLKLLGKRRKSKRGHG
ncbi:DExH-box ATP-dependent RNA helicase DExH3-like [Glycine soja]|uniref:RNA helicase n=1 Tax=Glycine soja TaxID=3848 RepID=A0A445JIT1_GLYSO|nr:DExH-box ATP-dependent RNA helicase DExH3-like [Glycine soja]RZB98371.1 DExH-box ATP-dependent RNA helicase DExH3 [Glycine soja]